MELGLSWHDVQSREVAFADFGFVMGLVRSRGAESENIDVALLQKEIHPIPNGLLSTVNRAAGDHLNPVVITQKKRIFYG